QALNFVGESIGLLLIDISQFLPAFHLFVKSSQRGQHFCGSTDFIQDRLVRLNGGSGVAEVTFLYVSQVTRQIGSFACIRRRVTSLRKNSRHVFIALGLLV